MSQDIARYIEVVGKDNLKKHLKESLKAELSKAIANENWHLIREITGLIENTFNQSNYENEQCLMRSIEIIGVAKLNLRFKDFLNQNIEGEQ